MLKKILPYAISAAVGLVITIIIICCKGVFSKTDITVVMQILSDAFFVPGVILAGVGLLIFASNGGMFDMLAYGTISFINLFRKDSSKRKYKDYYEYRQAKKDRKRDMAFLLIVGLVFIAIAAIFLIVYVTKT